MNVQEFIEKNLSNAKFDRDFNRYLYLKERLGSKKTLCHLKKAVSYLMSSLL